MKIIKLSVVLLLLVSFILLGVTAPAIADDVDAPSSGLSVLLEEVLVSARKREESAQSVPISVSAYGSQQLEALKIRNLENLSVGMPNVAMDDIRTTAATANFSIRGLGINSSIPSIDPTVGVFIDGVYIGQNAGVVVDMFDIQSIEVLRGPQGTLFGRNVTGGAVLINTKRPGDELAFSARAAIDGNPNGDGGTNTYAMASISGPLGENFGVRLSVYQNSDDGWHVNQFDGKNFGEANTTIFRPMLTWQVTEAVDMTLRWEHMETDGDGPASQNHTNGSGVPSAWTDFDRDSFGFAVDNGGFFDVENDLVSWETNIDVAFGNGTITNIFGWRDFVSLGSSDIDAVPQAFFHADFWSDAEQYSNELRYHGIFGKSNVTAGVYWFTNEVNYHERRNLLGIAIPIPNTPAQRQDGGGDYFVDSMAAFFSVDHDLNDSWSLNAGIRFTEEEKEANITSLVRNVSAFPALTACNVTEGTCSFDFNDKHSWSAWSGKLGAAYAISDSRRIYGHWSLAHRSGGYNLRNTAIDTVNLGPGPFDEETVSNFEIGYKSELAGRGRFNAAVFYNQIDDMQREINLSDPISGVVQVIKNTADAEIFGIELDGTFALTDNLVLMASLGWIDPSYKSVIFDLNGDGVIDSQDESLKLPRAAELTYSVGLTHSLTFSNGGELTSRISYAYRDDSYYTDNNNGTLLAQDMLNMGLDYLTAGGRWGFSLYGRNLLDSVSHGGDTQLPSMLGPLPLGGTFSPLAKGQVVGLEVTFNY